MPDLFVRGDLHDLGKKHSTQKAHKIHDYLRLYEFFLASLRGQNIVLMELGAGMPPTMGASFFMWEEYFPNAQIVGVDNKREAAKLSDGRPRLTIEVGDLGRAAFLEYLSGKHEPDVIIDDASHKWAHQILAIETLFDSLKPGGVYICEDIHTSFGDLRPKFGNGEDAFSYISTLSALVCGDEKPHPALERATEAQRRLAKKIDFAGIYGHVAILVKRP